MKVDVSREIHFRTARSGGKGGQHVNKVETQVEGLFHVADSVLLSAEEKDLVSQRLVNRINGDGFLQVRSQTFRSQRQNKEEVVRKMNDLIAKSLHRPKKRKPTQPTAGSKEKRLEEKKKLGQSKAGRKKITRRDLE